MSNSRPAQHMIVNDYDKRLIAGWASVEIRDLQGDIIPASVLERAMYDFMARGGVIIYGHSNMPIGKVLRWEIREHPETHKLGLWIEAMIYNDSVIANDVWEQIRQGKLKGFSISGVGKEEKVKYKDADGREVEADIITWIELAEISVVEEPANPLARIEAVNYMAKSADRNEAKSEGAVTTQTPSAFNPVYGGNQSLQVSMEANVAGTLPSKPRLKPEELERIIEDALEEWVEANYRQYGYDSPDEMMSELVYLNSNSLKPVNTATEGVNHAEKQLDDEDAGVKPGTNDERVDQADAESSVVEPPSIEQPGLSDSGLDRESLEQLRQLLVEMREIIEMLRRLRTGG